MATTLFEIPFMIPGRFVGLILDIVILALTVYYVGAKEAPYLRRVPALDAIDEAVGRSTEMGRPVLYTMSTGWYGFDWRILTCISLLSQVARIAARNEARLVVPTGGSERSYIIRPAIEEAVKTAFTVEGKPELFNSDDLPFFSGQQYAYIGGVVGMMQRDVPGALFGIYGASEAMNFAETANALGSITINSPSYPANAAVLACASDYIIWPEEAPAASAYLSGDPEEVAPIKTQDIMKWGAIILMIVGSIALTAGSDIIQRILAT
jgi:hypothetical protein